MCKKSNCCSFSVTVRVIFYELNCISDVTFLDHAGTTLVSRSQLEAHHRDISSNIYGNPHSRSPSSQLTTDTIDQIRYRYKFWAGIQQLLRYKLVFVPIEDSDQPAHLRSLIRVQCCSRHKTKTLITVQTYLICRYHWRSFHDAFTHVRNKSSNIQGRSPNVVKVIFLTIRNCSKRKEFAPSGSKFFPLRDIPILFKTFRSHDQDGHHAHIW